MSDENDFSLAINRGDPTPEELAAVMAVISEAYAAEVQTARAVEPPQLSLWMRTRRSMRGRMRRDLGFGGYQG